MRRGNGIRGRWCRRAAMALCTTLMIGLGQAEAQQFTRQKDQPYRVTPGEIVTEGALHKRVNRVMSLADSTVVQMSVGQHAVARPLEVTLPIDGRFLTLDLQPYSVRAPGYQVLAQVEDGSFVEHAPGPIRTLRGTVREDGSVQVAGSLLEDGLHVRLFMADGSSWWLEPVADEVQNLAKSNYVIYRGEDVIAVHGGCGVPNDPNRPDAADENMDMDMPTAGVVRGGGLAIAELACDADVQYFNDYGTVANVESRINFLTNQVNIQYEGQVQISHQLTTILVRTAEPDPYSSSDSTTLLCQFITEWTNNQGSIQRDVAKLFTGRSINGGVIGQAADIGDICNENGCCSCGPFGTDGSYCFSWSDFNGVNSCATDLMAHELGHLWGAFHCSCPSNTMNPSITCTNNFSNGTRSSIISYASSVTCLDGGAEPPPNDLCSGAELIDCNSTTLLNNALAGPAQNDGGPGDPQLPAGSPSCQWQNPPVPTNVHNTVWYRFVADDTSVEIETCNTTAIEDTIIALYSGSCGNLTQLACGEDDCAISGNPYRSRICAGGLVPGNTYYIMIGNPGGWTGSIPGDIVLDVACPCPDIGTGVGACCFSDGSCMTLTSSQCSQAGGSFQGIGSDCSPNPCQVVTGACCFGDGTCQELTANDCQQFGGSYQGDGTDCSPNPCAQPTGACCFSNGTCQVLTATQCQNQGGNYQGNGTDCSPNPCPQPTGACCFPDGSCAELTATQCQNQGGSYQGNGTDCSPNPCPQPTGACCFSDGTCQVLTAQGCQSAGGVYQGDFSSCTPNPCPQPTGACCFPDGSCAELTAAACQGQGGSYQGDFTDCTPNPCPQPVGACCFPDGSCAELTAAACQGQGGVYQGDFTDCTPNPCPQPVGACCFSDGSCLELTEADCNANGGMYQGDFVSCNPNPCPQPPTGACCLTDGSCVELTAVDCQGQGGAYQGDGTSCNDNPCFSGCPGDCNGDNVVDINDLNVVIGNFGNSGAPGIPGDCNLDGSVDINDLNGVIGNFGTVCQ